MEVLYCVGTAAFKYSALFLFHRIFGSLPHFTAFLWCFAFVIFANNIAEIFLSIFQCTPVHKAWDTEVKGSCVPVHLAAVIPAAINVVTDVITVLIPVPIIWNLQMERNRKLQLVGIFLLSGLYVPFQCSPSPNRPNTTTLTITPKRLHSQHLPNRNRQAPLPRRRKLSVPPPSPTPLKKDR